MAQGDYLLGQTSNGFEGPDTNPTRLINHCWFAKPAGPVHGALERQCFPQRTCPRVEYVLVRDIEESRKLRRTLCDRHADVVRLLVRHISNAPFSEHADG